MRLLLSCERKELDPSFCSNLGIFRNLPSCFVIPRAEINMKICSLLMEGYRTVPEVGRSKSPFQAYGVIIALQKRCGELQGFSTAWEALMLSKGHWLAAWGRKPFLLLLETCCHGGRAAHSSLFSFPHTSHI